MKDEIVVPINRLINAQPITSKSKDEKKEQVPLLRPISKAMALDTSKLNCRTFAKEIDSLASYHMAKPEMALQTVLAAYTLAVQDLADVMNERVNKREMLCLYFFTIARSGEMKSSCNNTSNLAVMETQSQEIKNFNRLIKDAMKDRQLQAQERRDNKEAKREEREAKAEAARMLRLSKKKIEESEKNEKPIDEHLYEVIKNAEITLGIRNPDGGAIKEPNDKESLEDELENAGKKKGADLTGLCGKDGFKPKPIQAPDHKWKPTIIEQNLTVEGLYNALEKGRPSKGFYHSEAGSFLGGYSMRKENRLHTMCEFSSLWDTGYLSRTRGTADSNMVMYDRRLSIHLMVQPDMASDFITDEKGKNQGILARFLMVDCPPYEEKRMLEEEETPETKKKKEENQASIDKFKNRLLDIYALPRKIDPDTGGVITRLIYLSPEANRLWVRFYNSTQCRIKDSKELDDIPEFAAKAGEMAIRIAGVLAVNDDPDCNEVPEECMSDAIYLMNYYFSQWLRMCSIGGCEKDIEDAQKFLDWMKEQPEQAVHSRMIARQAPRCVRTKEDRDRIIEMLIEHGLIEKLPKNTKVNGVARAHAWRVIPETPEAEE